MPTPIPLNISSRNQLLMLLNRDNNTHETFSTISFGPVSVAPEASNRNTKMTVTAIPGSGRAGSADVFYNRMDLTALFSGAPAVVVVTSMPTMTSDLLEPLNRTYGLHLDLEDIIDEVMLTPDTWSLKAAPGSYAFIGELTVNVVIQQNHPQIDLLTDSVVTNLSNWTPPINLGSDSLITLLDGFSAV